MSEFISSATCALFCTRITAVCASFPLIVGHFVEVTPWRDWFQFPWLGQMTRHQHISKPLYLSKPGRGTGTAQRLINSSFCFLLMKAFPREFIMLIMGDRLSHQEGIHSLKCQSRLNLLCSNAEDFICKPRLVFLKWPSLENTILCHF